MEGGERRNIKFKNICRTCLAKEGASNNIFEPENINGESVKIMDMLSLFTQLKITDGDSLPKNICKKCFYQLKIAYNFNKKSVRAQHILFDVVENFLNKSSTDTNTKEYSSKANENTSKNDNNIQQQNIKGTKEIKILPLNSTQPKTQLKIKQKPIDIVTNIKSNVGKIKNIKILPAPQTLYSILPKIEKDQTLKSNEGFESTCTKLEPVTIFNCLRCPKKFMSEQHLQTHMDKFHLEITPQKTCSVCNVTFETLEQLKAHNLTVHFPPTLAPDAKATCSICAREFTNKLCLRNHLRKVHVPSSGKVFCDRCGRFYLSVDGLKTHIKLYCSATKRDQPMDSEKSFTCEVCDEVFGDDESLVSHSKVHSLNLCQYCLKAFATEDQMQAHTEENHSGKKKPYECVYCSKTFPQKWVLSNHQRVKHQVWERVLLCGHCPGAYVGTQHLLEHLATSHCNLSQMTVDSEDAATEKDVNNENQNTTNDMNQMDIVNENPYIITYYVNENGENLSPTSVKFLTNDKETNDAKSDASNWSGKLVFVDTQQVLATNGLEQKYNDGKIDNDEVYSSTDGKNKIVELVNESNVVENMDETQYFILDGSMTENTEGETDLSEGRVSVFIDKAGKVTYIDSDGKVISKEKEDSKREGKKTGEITCNSCDQKFNNKREHRRHMTSIHGVRFRRDTAAAAASSTASRPLEIQGQGQEDTEGQLVEGIVAAGNTTDTSNAYSCQICSKKFLRLVNLEKHLSRHVQSTLRCVRCGHEACDPQQMDEHLNECRSAQAAERLVCPTCGKKLTTTAGFRYHIQTHSGIRRFACPSCGRRFLTCAGMRTHVRVVHSGARPHLCTLCGSRFPSADHLRKHARSRHFNTREHVCKVCNKRFLQSSHVAQHMWVHTGLKPYACPHCPNHYTASCSLTKHLRRNHWDLQHQKQTADEKIYKKLLNEEENSASLGSQSILANIDNTEQECTKETSQKNSYNSNETNILSMDIKKLSDRNTESKSLINPKKVRKLYQETHSNESLNASKHTLMINDEDFVVLEQHHTINSESNLTDNNNPNEPVNIDEPFNNYMIEEISQHDVTIREGNYEVVSLSADNDIVIDGVCADDLGDGINVVIVGGDDVTVDGEQYQGRIIW